MSQTKEVARTRQLVNINPPHCPTVLSHHQHHRPPTLFYPIHQPNPKHQSHYPKPSTAHTLSHRTLLSYPRPFMSTSSDSPSSGKKVKNMGSSHVKSGSSKKPSSASKSKSGSSANASEHSARGSYNDSGAGSSKDLPKSVRNAPPELRVAIRRRQNNESAKRSRDRKKDEHAEMHKKFHANSKRIEELEKQVDDLTSYLSKKKSSKKGKGSERDNDDAGSSKNPGLYGDPF